MWQVGLHNVRGKFNDDSTVFEHAFKSFILKYDRELRCSGLSMDLALTPHPAW
jgi:hypothetical protein